MAERKNSDTPIFTRFISDPSPTICNITFGFSFKCICSQRDCLYRKIVVNNKHNVNPHRHNFLHSSTDIRHAYPHLPNSHLLTRALIAHQGQPHAKLILHYHMSYHKYRGQQSICCGNTLPRVPTIQRLMPTPAAIKICILFDLTLQMSKFTK